MKKSKRPVLKIPRSPLENVIEVLAVLGIIVHALILYYYWPALPDVIPTHFGISGEADGWGSKNTLFSCWVWVFFICTDDRLELFSPYL